MEGSNEVFDVIVVGAGIEGSATAYNLVKNGKSTLLLEQVINLIRFLYMHNTKNKL
jgi:glycerol-3-phosphate dehydrogenase